MPLKVRKITTFCWEEGGLMMARFAVVNALLKHQWPQQNGLENTLALKVGFFNSEYMY